MFWSIDAGFAHESARYRIEPADKCSRLARYVEVECIGPLQADWIAHQLLWNRPAPK